MCLTIFWGALPVRCEQKTVFGHIVECADKLPAPKSFTPCSDGFTAKKLNSFTSSQSFVYTASSKEAPHLYFGHVPRSTFESHGCSKSTRSFGD